MRFSALAIPFLRRISEALSKSPPDSSSARLQSIIPAPVRVRSSLTSLEEIVVLAIVSNRVNSGVNSKAAAHGLQGLRAAENASGPGSYAPVSLAAPGAAVSATPSASASVLSRAAIASGLGRRLRRGRRRFRSASASPSLPASVL